MKYLSNEPFTIAVRTPKELKWRYVTDAELMHRRKNAKRKHKFENMGVMCGLCGLGKEAKIHQ